MARNNKYNDREYDLIKKLKYENKKLKKQNAALRKQLQRVDIDRYENLKDIIYKHYKQDDSERIKEEKKKLKEKWQCHNCRDGFLKLFTYSRQDGLYYYRKCTNCDNRTKPKPYTNKVEGLEGE